MKAKSVLRRLEQLEKRIAPKRGGTIVVLLDDEPTQEDREQYSGYDNVVFIIEGEIPD